MSHVSKKFTISDIVSFFNSVVPLKTKHSKNNNEIFLYSCPMSQKKFTVSDIVSFFTEAAIISQSWAPGQSAWTRTISIQGSESGITTYVDKVTYPVTKSAIYGVPTQDVKQYIPFGSFGFHAGVLFSFGAKAAAEKK